MYPRLMAGVSCTQSSRFFRRRVGVPTWPPIPIPIPVFRPSRPSPCSKIHPVVSTTLELPSSFLDVNRLPSFYLSPLLTVLPCIVPAFLHSSVLLLLRHLGQLDSTFSVSSTTRSPCRPTVVPLMLAFLRVRPCIQYSWRVYRVPNLRDSIFFRRVSSRGPCSIRGLFVFVILSFSASIRSQPLIVVSVVFLSPRLLIDIVMPPPLFYSSWSILRFSVTSILSLRWLSICLAISSSPRRPAIRLAMFQLLS